MIKKSKTLVFFGNERLVSGLKSTDTPILRGLIERGYTIAAVVSHHSDSHSRTKRPLEVAIVAEQHNIPVLLDKPAAILDTLRSYNADAAVLVAYGRIIPQRVIDIFPGGIINIHPSLLPKYRGPTPIESAIANGDSTTGVSIMQLTAGMDEGPVYAQQIIPLRGNETKFDLYKKVIHVSTDLLFSRLDAIIGGEITPTPQDSSQATYCNLLTKHEGVLKPDTQTATEAERSVRAYLEYPKSRLTLFDLPCIITKAQVVTEKQSSLDIAFKQDFLRIQELITPNGKRMDAASFLRGYAKR